MVIDKKTNLINVSLELPPEVSRWNKTNIDNPLDRTVISFFEQQACVAQQCIAVQFREISLTYEELNRLANCCLRAH